MIIGKIDAVVTNKLQTLEERKMSATKYEAQIKQLGQGCNTSLEVQEGPSATSDDESSCKMSEESDDSEDFDGSNLPQNRNQYPELSKAVDRAKVSNRDACLIVNAILKDLGMLTSENTLYPNKLRRQDNFGGRNYLCFMRRKTKELYVSGLMEKLMRHLLK